MTDEQKLTCSAIVNVFEGGSILGNYSAISTAKGDTGHLSYGRSQVTLGSGNLYLMLKAYCEAPDAQFASELTPYMDRMAHKDFSLDNELPLKAILREAGHDPAMRREQDAYFDRAYFQPSISAAARVGLGSPLSIAIVYDSHIQGAWKPLSDNVVSRLGRVGAGCTESKWVTEYVAMRRAFLLRGKPPLPVTVYRMEGFGQIVTAGNWQLKLPIKVHGVNITPEALGPVTALPVVARVTIPDPEIDNRPLLRPALPYLRGDGVQQFQHLLNGAGLKNSEDGVYGPFTQALARHFQAGANLKPDAVVGPQTWRELLDHQTVAA